MNEQPTPALKRIIRRSDIQIAINATSLIEDLLRQLVRETFRDRYYCVKSLASRYNGLVNLAHLTNLVSRGMFDDLLVLSYVRNKFAHSHQELDFDSEPIIHKLIQFPGYQAARLRGWTNKDIFVGVAICRARQLVNAIPSNHPAAPEKYRP